MEEKANILVLGTSGAGKSTLINTVLGREAAKVGIGKHITEEMQAYDSDDLNFRLIDSRGFEYNGWNTRKAVKDMNAWLKTGLKEKKPSVHMLWLCIDATSKRFTKQTIKTMEAVKKEWKDVPIIVVLTKSFFEAEDADNIRMVEETFRKFAKNTGMPIAIIPVLAEAPKGIDIVPRGIEELIETTENNLDEAIRDANEAVRSFDIKYKKKKAQALTIAAATSGAVIGAIPIDFPDAAVLTPLETAMITGIAKIYNLDKKDDYKAITTRLVETGTVSIVAKTTLNHLKLIPGIANIAADVVNALVAGAIVLSLGEASIKVMEMAYLGKIDKKDLNWIDKIVEKSMGTIVKRVSDTVSEQQGSINPSIILKSLIGKGKN